MYVEALRLGPLETNCWLVGDGAVDDIVVIDPADDADTISSAVGTRNVSAIVLTHCHFDHLAAVSDLLGMHPAPLLAHEADAGYLTTTVGTGGELFGFLDVAPPADRMLRDGEIVRVGSLEMLVMSTPGHTPGGICLFCRDPEGGPPHLFSGDTLFAGSVGRSDFPRGDGRDLRRSIAEKLAPLPPETVVHPGHGPDTTIGREARINPFWPRG